MEHRELDEALLLNDGIQPAQFFPEARLDCGEKSLLFAMLEDAIRQIQGDGGSGRRRNARRAARLWIRTVRDTWGGFDFICAIFDLDAAKLRRRLLGDGTRIKPVYRTEAVTRSGIVVTKRKAA